MSKFRQNIDDQSVISSIQPCSLNQSEMSYNLFLKDEKRKYSQLEEMDEYLWREQKSKMRKEMRDISFYLKKMQEDYRKRRMAYEQFSFQLSQCHETIFDMYNTLLKQKQELRIKGEDYKKQIEKLILEKRQLLEKIEEMNRKEETNNIMYTRLIKKLKNKGNLQQNNHEDLEEIQGIKDEYQKCLKDFQMKSKKKHQCKDVKDKLRQKFYAIYSKFKEICDNYKRQGESRLKELQNQKCQREIIEKQKQIQSDLKQREYREKLQFEAKLKKYQYLFHQKQRLYKSQREIMKQIFDNFTAVIQKYQVTKIKNYQQIFMQLQSLKPRWLHHQNIRIYSKTSFEESIQAAQKQNDDLNPEIIQKSQEKLPKQKSLQDYILQIRQNFNKLQIIILALVKIMNYGQQRLNFSNSPRVFYEKQQDQNEVNDSSQYNSSVDNSIIRID